MTRPQAIVGGVIAVAAVIAILAIGAVKGARPSLKGADGTVYVESNSSAPSSNEVLAFRYHDGSLNPRHVHRYPMHGSGSHDLSNSGVLDADQELITNPQRTLLYAVNSSSDTIAAFHIHPDGTLTAVTGSPFPSNGKAPASLGLAGDTLIVANKAQDGVRNLRTVPANYTSFHMNADGSLSKPISSIDVPPRSSPLQTYVTPDHKVVIASEESGVFRAFRIGPDGKLTQGPNSPLPLDPRVFPGGRRIPINWPAGLVSHPTQQILYAQDANISHTIVYRWDDDARLTFVRSMRNPKSFLPCWTEVNASGTRMYSGNAGSDNLTVYDISADPTNPRMMQSFALNAPGNPWNFNLDPSGRLIFMVDMRAVRQVPGGLGNDLHVLKIKKDGRLEEDERASPAKIPVPVGTNPLGLAIYPHS